MGGCKQTQRTRVDVSSTDTKDKSGYNQERADMLSQKFEMVHFHLVSYSLHVVMQLCLLTSKCDMKINISYCFKDQSPNDQILAPHQYFYSLALIVQCKG